jgi:23S rRNA (pseudouridine1915-N3)-methyltransferase
MTTRIFHREYPKIWRLRLSKSWAAGGGILLSMQLILAHVGARIPGGDEFNRLTLLYLQRASSFLPCEAMAFRGDAELREWLDRKGGRTPPVAVLLDSRGRQMTSEAFGPASGWSNEARQRAQLLLSFGPLTMAHALARLVLAEQIYRACTILAGHPYHVGH